MSLSEFISRRVIVGVIGAGTLLVRCRRLKPRPTRRRGHPTAQPPTSPASRPVSRQSLTTYLFTHPDVNGFYTGLQDQPKDQIGGEVQNYFGANPQEEAELEGIRQPLTDIRERCHWTPLLGQGAA